VNAGNFTNTLADVGMTAFDDLVEKIFGDEMGIGIDAHQVLRDSSIGPGGLPVQ
jgi:hypothetical protein